MRLAKIKLAGFKSFVEPTVIPVTQGLVGIVGPNGCGKSNIIDAVRWVLGESKASALRGDSMQDVIFNGSVNRKAVGRASVELIFDNTLNAAGGQWSSYAEIAIKRIIQREGQSNYYINNLHVRRRDITDLFLGTGIGGRGYAIIEQGMISRIIEAKPQDLKRYLEEAAGISKYHERRQETALRLTDTRKNLVRIEDLANELKKQIEHLDNQAKIAHEYNALDQKRHQTQHLLWLQHRIEATKQRIAAQDQISQLEQALETETLENAKRKTQREKIRVHEQKFNEQLHETQGQYYSANAEKTRVEQEIKQFRKNNEQLAHQIRDFDNQLTRNQQQLATATENLKHWHVEKQNAQAAYESSLHQKNLENEKLPELEKFFNQCQKTLDAHQQDLIRAEQANSLANTHYQHSIKSIQQLESRHSRLKQEYDKLSQPDHGALYKIQSQLEQITQQITEIQNKLSQAESEYADEAHRKNKLTAQTLETQKALSQLQAQFNALHHLQQKIENNETLKLWLHRYTLESLPRLWHYLKVDQNWENALESILQERLNSIGFQQLEICYDWKNDLPPGKLAVFEYQKPIVINEAHRSDSPAQRPAWHKLSEYLTCDDDNILAIVHEWLENIYVTEDFAAGLQQRHLLLPSERLLTREGHLLSHNSITFYSPDSHLHGVLSRQRELDHIKAEIQTSEETLKTQQADLKEITQHYEKLHQAIQSYRSNHQQLVQQQHTLQLEKTKLVQINEQVKQRKEQITSELNEINQQRIAENLQKEQSEQQTNDYDAQIEALKKQLKISKDKLTEATQSLNNQRNTIQTAANVIQESAFHEKICQNKINDIEHAIKRIDEEKKHLLVKKETLVSEKAQLDGTTLETQLNTCLLQCKAFEKALSDNRIHLEETRQQLLEIEKAALHSEQKQTTLRESINQLQLKKQSFSLTEERYSDQLNEAQADETSLMPLVDQKSITTLQAELNRINKAITALGPVNLAALEELEESRNRESHLDSQISDLNEAITILETAINQIDQETKRRLQKTFDAVNNNLKEIFPIIFSGGTAELVLSDGKILDSGILLTAQPPGKKNNSLHLLSGGEKALTALALIFSLFRLNPAPFCLLDEVDAPLDDSNTGRFCELVKKLSQQTQFLFISHNKITMEIAQQLIGITMQEQGISRVVAVDFSSAIQPGAKDIALL